MGKRALSTVVSLILVCFYIVIILYVFFNIIRINTLNNYLPAMIFEFIGFIILGFLIVGNIFSRPIKVGYFVPLVILTVAYTVILDVINIVLIKSLEPPVFMLVNSVVLFVYFVVSAPMYIMGKK